MPATILSIPPQVTSTWHPTIAALPPEQPAPTPFHTREWAAAWQSVRTEPVLARHHLYLQPQDTDTRGFRLSFSLVDGSPLWQAMENDAGTAAVFEGAVLYGPSVYGEYGGLPGAPAPVLAEAVDRGRQLAAELDSEALVISNLTQSQHARWVSAREPDAEVTLYWAHTAPAGEGLDDFLSAAASKHRSEFKRQYRKGRDAGLRLHIARGPDLLPFLPQFTAQARATSERHGPALYGLDMLEPLTRVPGATGILALTSDGDLAGGFFCFRYASCFYLWSAAIDQSRKHDFHTYGWLMHQSALYAAESGARVIDVGRSNYLYKARLGFGTDPLTSLVYLTRPNPRLVSRLRALDTALRADAHRAWARTGSHSPA